MPFNIAYTWRLQRASSRWESNWKVYSGEKWSGNSRVEDVACGWTQNGRSLNPVRRQGRGCLVTHYNWPSIRRCDLVMFTLLESIVHQMPCQIGVDNDASYMPSFKNALIIVLTSFSAMTTQSFLSNNVPKSRSFHFLLNVAKEWWRYNWRYIFTYNLRYAFRYN